MGLSCECGAEDYDWYFEPDDDYSTLKTSRRKRCESCNSLIDIGAIVVKHECWRPPNSDIEDRIHGTQVYTADKFTCEKCSDIYFSLADLGFCLSLGSMQDQLAEYWEYVEESKPHKLDNHK